MVKLERDSPKGRAFTFDLKALLWVVAIFGILSAWFVDHSRLVRQIATPLPPQLKVYRLTNASGDLATRKLNQLFKTHYFSLDEGTNSIYVNAPRIDQDRITLILAHIDRKGTEYVDAKDPSLGVAAEESVFSKR